LEAVLISLGLILGISFEGMRHERCLLVETYSYSLPRNIHNNEHGMIFLLELED
jgi:hypothetical protein